MLLCWWNFALIFFSRCFSTDLRVYQKSDKFWETYKSENRARSGIPSATDLLSQFQNRKAGYPSWNVGPYRQILEVMQLWWYWQGGAFPPWRIPTRSTMMVVGICQWQNFTIDVWWLIILLLSWPSMENKVRNSCKHEQTFNQLTSFVLQQDDDHVS